jgi:hypothetical protein
MLRVFLKETGKEIKGRPMNFCLGSCSVFIVVVCFALLLTVLAQGEAYPHVLGRYSYWLTSSLQRLCCSCAFPNWTTGRLTSCLA